jgi:signal transduction histidine kinase/ligand-binding sensor domain-containing protein
MSGRRSVYILKSLIWVPLMFWLGFAHPLYAQDQTIFDQTISQMVHTAWTGRDGAPQGITALAQTPDGMLWIGGDGGLYTFDGLNFVAFNPRAGSPPLPASGIRFVFVSKAGDLWVSPYHGPAIRIHDGETQLYDHADGDHLDVIGQVQQDSSGTLWSVLNEKHLVLLGPDSIWHEVENPIAKPGHVSKLFIDSSNTHWVIENDLLYRKSEGETEFTATAIQVYGPAKILESRDRSLWVMGQGPTPAGMANLQHVGRFGQKLYAPQVHGEIDTILIAPDGSLWISSRNDKLQRFGVETVSGGHSDSGANASDYYALKNGAMAFGLQALFSDDDGNIWVGRMAGLDRFRNANLVSAFPDAEVGLWHSCVDTQGEVWVVNGDNQLFVIENGHPSLVHSWSNASNLFCGNEKRVYVLDDSGISVVRDRRIRHLPLLPGFTGYGDHYLFLGVIEETDGDLIASVGGAAGHGLWKYSAGRWTRLFANLALPEVHSMFEDAQGTLFLAFTNDRSIVGRIRNGSLETLQVTVKPFGFASTSYGILAFGGSGIAVEREGSFQTLSFLHSDHTRLITSVVESNSGDLWINGARGIVRIPASEVRAAIADPAHALSSVDFQEGDFVGPDLLILFRNSAHVDRSGRLWFSTMNGVVSVDPDHLALPQHPPLLSIRSIVADGHAMDASAAFPPDTRTLEVKYFGLDLTDPRRVVYRYRLEGPGSDSRDSSWQDAGTRTEAAYTHLRPGSYRFQVMASNGNDVWTQPISSATFRILPHFYERPWVQGLFVLAGVVLIWVAISLRVRYVSGAIRIRAEERADERIRIARELHDTLLQGVQGLLLSFHVAAEKVPADHESKPALERALTTADHIIVEGRNRVNRLRSENLTDGELESLIEGVADNLRGIASVEFALERRGGGDTLQSHVVDEIFCIAREAVTNAYRHSGASRITVELDYQKHEFRMTCRDNGRGFDPKKFLANRANGHWGLRGMAERAKEIDASFSCDSPLNGGTEVRVIVPARRAYQRQKRFQFFGGQPAA